MSQINSVALKSYKVIKHVVPRYLEQVTLWEDIHRSSRGLGELKHSAEEDEVFHAYNIDMYEVELCSISFTLSRHHVGSASEGFRDCPGRLFNDTKGIFALKERREASQF